jgi:hypothetical protein
MADKYPERNYVPMYPKGHDKPPSDGQGKGNIGAHLDAPGNKGKGNNPKNYDEPGKAYPNNPKR